MKVLTKKAIGLLSIVWTVVLACGCNKTPIINGNPTIDYSFEDDHLVGLCEMRLPNVVELRYGDSFATGFIYTQIGGDAVVVTNRHLSGDDTFSAGHVDARFYGETSFRSGLFTMLGSDKRYDVVFLRCSSKPDKAVDLRASIAVDCRMGQRVLLIGNGMGTGLAAAEGIVAQPDKIVTVKGNTVPAVQISAPVNAGNSGSPLFNMKGELIGVNFAQTVTLADNPDRYVDGVSYSIPIDIVESLYRAAAAMGASEPNMEVEIPQTDCVALTEVAAAKEFAATLTHLGVYLRLTDEGLRVTGTSATSTLGLQDGDYIEAVGGERIANYRKLIVNMLRFGSNGTGKTLAFDVRRGEGTLKVEATDYKEYAA